MRSLFPIPHSWMWKLRHSLSNLLKGTILCLESHALGNQPKGADLGVSPHIKAKGRAISLTLSSSPSTQPPHPEPKVTSQHRTPLCPWPCLLQPSKKGGEGRKQQGHSLQPLGGPGPQLISPCSYTFPRSSESAVGTAANTTVPGQAGSWRGPTQPLSGPRANSPPSVQAGWALRTQPHLY